MGHRDQPPRTKCATFPRGLPSSPSPIPTRPPGFALSLRDQADTRRGAYYVKRPICICDIANKTKHVIQSPVDGEPIVVFYKDSHYEATPPEEAVGWESWGTGQRSENVEPSSSIAVVDAPPSKVTVNKRYKLNQRVTIDGHMLSPSDRVEVLEIKSDQVRVKYSRSNAGIRAGLMTTAALDLATEGNPIWSKFSV